MYDNNKNNNEVMKEESSIAPDFTWHVYHDCYTLINNISGLKYTPREIYPHSTSLRNKLISEGHNIAYGLGYRI